MTSMVMASYKFFFLFLISCNVCHEFCPLYRSEAANVPPTNTTASQAHSGISLGKIVVIVVSICAAVLMFIVGSCCLVKRIRKKYDSVCKDRHNAPFDSVTEIDVSNLDSLQYDFHTIKSATNKFCADDKLDEGGLGVVYKGVLPNGQEIAVKRLHRSSIQGTIEFKNEVEVLARVRHKNLVRLLGFCLGAEESTLVYEYMPKRSLDYILFDPEQRRQLDWTKRYNIIKGIAQGIQYLHDESSLGRIIHRDLKPGHVLLDSEINPKITGFGVAMVFGVDQTERHGNLVGSLGYIAPEYVVTGLASAKIDVYSFGVLLLEIISGERNISLRQMKGDGDLLRYAWGLWKDGEPLELLDPTIRECYTPYEVMRCIHIALLCIQENPMDRPLMSSVLLMLECYSMTLPTPS